MAHNQLSEKLDLITDAELNTDFDSSAVWSRLEERLEERNPMVYWWTVAACILALILFLPINLLKETATEIQPVSTMVESTIDQPSTGKPVEVKEVLKKEQFIQPFKSLEKKGIEKPRLAEVLDTELVMEPIALSERTTKRAVFAPEDISIIQASLEKPKVGKGRTMTIRAQWQKSPTKSNVEHQALKIKLYEKDK